MTFGCYIGLGLHVLMFVLYAEVGLFLVILTLGGWCWLTRYLFCSDAGNLLVFTF